LPHRGKRSHPGVLPEGEARLLCSLPKLADPEKCLSKQYCCKQEAHGNDVLPVFRAIRAGTRPALTFSVIKFGKTLLLLGLLNSDSHGNGHADHGVVAGVPEALGSPGRAS